jgi:hypothetical protein
MFYKRIVQKALISTWESDIRPGMSNIGIPKGQDTIVSKLLYDIFGGEIMKISGKKGWHFYNRINGKRIDLSGYVTKRSIEKSKFEEIPATPAETSGYFDKTDYLTFLMRFVRVYEEAVGLKRYRESLTAI